MKKANELRNTSNVTSEPRQVSLSHHQRHCTVCRHAERDAIEQDFLDWRDPYDIAENYGLADRSSIYRHAHATGLFPLRRRNMRAALENLIERNDQVEVGATAIIRAVRACTRINDDGQWVEPPNRVVVTRTTAPEDAIAASSLPPADGDSTRGYPAGPDRDAFRQRYLPATEPHSKTESKH
jgi:hypothetical protein